MATSFQDGCECYHLIKAELEEGKVLVQSNTSLQTISAGKLVVKGKDRLKEGQVFPYPV